MLSLFLSAAGQVALVAVLLGAGLPVLFAVGVRSFAVASGAGAVGAGALAAGAPPARRSGLPAPLLRGIGALCFALVVGSVVIGLSVIIATGLGQSVSFEHMIPTFAPKG
ncbi:hypothetical protein [Rathayibacter rathayi]|uniref:Uncharacterized protein n=1 Tax=Rathayibacter rathayi TaxID=33887 RepID=A0ABX5AB31_RATRA|nr:hypothetical protein [Rathayibacter rathayi]AZZ50162.1 hypothetical protein C1O28_13985 [Rathayibacter rathayi]MWV74554.1 hypothetical protein [Rathayibacter rathayi NCPPB 2980 = VKM Ac-1601]PPF23853.1 hypothetical protein C5C34_07400 [Rathayibacter rathayi]PPF46537.1 hypothetical protein C5C08_11570 [Rathayibacter rathayi]PPG68733.1 hypothetical protein C5C16_07350 [Rathayibacter rathayi]